MHLSVRLLRNVPGLVCLGGSAGRRRTDTGRASMRMRSRSRICYELVLHYIILCKNLLTRMDETTLISIAVILALRASTLEDVLLGVIDA